MMGMDKRGVVSVLEAGLRWAGGYVHTDIIG